MLLDGAPSSRKSRHLRLKSPLWCAEARQNRPHAEYPENRSASAKKRWRGPTLDHNERWPRVSTDKNVQHARVLRIDGFLVKPPGIKVFERKIRRILSDRIRQALGIDSEKD